MERTRSSKFFFCSRYADFFFVCFTSLALLCRKLFNSLGVVTETGIRRRGEWDLKCQFVVQIAIPCDLSSSLSFSMKELAPSPLFFFFLILLSTILSTLQKVFKEADLLLTAVLYKSESTCKIIPSMDLCLMSAFPCLNKLCFDQIFIWGREWIMG